MDGLSILAETRQRLSVLQDEDAEAVLLTAIVDVLDATNLIVEGIRSSPATPERSEVVDYVVVSQISWNHIGTHVDEVEALYEDLIKRRVIAPNDDD